MKKRDDDDRSSSSSSAERVLHILAPATNPSPRKILIDAAGLHIDFSAPPSSTPLPLMGGEELGRLFFVSSRMRFSFAELGAHLHGNPAGRRTLGAH